MWDSSARDRLHRRLPEKPPEKYTLTFDNFTLMESRLDVPSTRLKTVGDRAFSVAGAHLWNKLPDDIVNCQLLSAFRRMLNSHLFKQSFLTLYLIIFLFLFIPIVALRFF
jgi:hypothetical protein